MSAASLVASIEGALTVLESGYRNSATESDLYEASLFVLAVDALRNAGAQVLITSNGRTSAGNLRFRRSPGNLWAGQFTYAVGTAPVTGKRLEAHLGVYVNGASGVAHECDVAILDGREADRSRAGQVHPRRLGLVAAIEAKHYVASPGIGVGRGFLGLSSELGGKKCSLSFPAKGSPSLTSLLAKKPSECFDELIPGTAAATRLGAHLDQDIRNWLA